MKPKIRSATLDDVPPLLAIERETTNAAHWTKAQYTERVAQGAILVAESEGSVVGFVCARQLASVWEIENIVVAAEHRRRGVADELLRELLRCSSSGTAVWLEVRESNGPARRLYEKHGFRETGRRRGYYRDPLEDALLYELRLEVDQ